MKKLIALLLVAVFVSTGIVGCGSETTKKAETKAAPGGTGGPGGAGGGAKP